MITTINSLPEIYKNTCTAVINDKDIVVVARTMILLLVALRKVSTDTTELMLHIWYSVRLPFVMAKVIDTEIKPLIADVVHKIKDRSEKLLQSKTWSLDTASVTVRLYKPQWRLVLKMLESVHSATTAEHRRRDLVFNKNRVDFRERHYFDLTPSMRLCAHKFRETGVLLPFGHCVNDFEVANV